MAIAKIPLEKAQDVEEEEKLKRILSQGRTFIRPDSYWQRQIDFFNRNNWPSGYVGQGHPAVVYVPTSSANNDIENIGNLPQTNYVATDWNSLTPAQQQAWYTQAQDRLQYAPGETPQINSYTGQFGVNPAYFSQDAAARNQQTAALQAMNSYIANKGVSQTYSEADLQNYFDIGNSNRNALRQMPGQYYYPKAKEQQLQNPAEDYIAALNQIQQNYMLAQMSAPGAGRQGWTPEAYMADVFGMVKDAEGNYKRRENAAYGTGGGGGSASDPTGIGGAAGGAAGGGTGYAFMPNFRNAFTVGIPNWFFGLPTSQAELASKSAGAGLGAQNIAPTASSTPVGSDAWLDSPYGQNIFFNMPQNKYTQSLQEFFPTENIPYSSYVKGERPDVAYGEQDVFVGGGGTGITYQGGYGMSNRMPAPISAQMLQNQQRELLSGANTSVLPALSQYIEQNYGLPWDTYLNYVSDAYWGKKGNRLNMRAYNQR